MSDNDYNELLREVAQRIAEDNVEREFERGYKCTH